MKTTLIELFRYLKAPDPYKNENTDKGYRITKLLHLFIISVVSALVLAIPISIIEALGIINTDKHAVSELLANKSVLFVLFSAVIIAPLFEELIFRAPITLFSEHKNFKFFFYLFAVLFGLVHLFNFKDNFTITTLLVTPILIAPQTVLGGYLGFIRVKFGLLWSILLHAVYNGLFIGITLLAK